MAFWKKPTMQEQMRANDRDLKRQQRTLERDRGQMDREEKKLEMEIKKAAKQGNREAAAVLAKQLVQLRKQRTRSYQMGAKVSSVSAQQKVMGANVKMADSMKATTKTMQSMNKMMKPEDTMKTMQQFEQETMKMDMKEDVMNDMLDDIFAGSDDEEEQEAVVNQVLDEIGIDISDKLRDAPSAPRDSAAARSGADDDILKRLEQLNS